MKLTPTAIAIKEYLQESVYSKISDKRLRDLHIASLPSIQRALKQLEADGYLEKVETKLMTTGMHGEYKTVYRVIGK